MKKTLASILSILITLSIIITALGETNSVFFSSPTPSVADTEFVYHNGVRLGMTMNEVRQIEGKENEQVDNCVLIYRNIFVAGEMSTLYYMFYGKGTTLSVITVQIDQTYFDADTYILDFNRIDAALGTKYSEGDARNVYIWKDDKYKDDEQKYGFAITTGDLSISSQWLYGETEITHILKGNNGQIEHTISYHKKDQELPVDTNGL